MKTASLALSALLADSLRNSPQFSTLDLANLIGNDHVEPIADAIAGSLIPDESVKMMGHELHLSKLGREAAAVLNNQATLRLNLQRLEYIHRDDDEGTDPTNFILYWIFETGKMEPIGPAPTKGDLIGHSLSLGVLSILRGEVTVDRVKKIICKANATSRALAISYISQLQQQYWHKYGTRGFDIAMSLLDQNMIEFPQAEGREHPNWDNSIWESA